MVGFGGLIFVLLLIMIVVKISKKRREKKAIRRLNKNFILAIGIVGLISLFLIFFKSSITGGIVGVEKISDVKGLEIFEVLIILLLGIIFGILIYVIKEIRQIKAKIEKINNLRESVVERQKEENKDSKDKSINNKKYKTEYISKIINKKVYTNSGSCLGKIEKIILENNKIDSLKIRLDALVRKEKNVRYKGILINYMHVKNVGDIVILDKRVSEHLKEYGAKD